MDETIKQISNELVGFLLDSASSGTARGSIKLVFCEVVPPTERRPPTYISVEINGLTPKDVKIEKVKV